LTGQENYLYIYAGRTAYLFSKLGNDPKLQG
jgi:hypothetical protein